jgi:hypothetical protein
VITGAIWTHQYEASNSAGNLWQGQYDTINGPEYDIEGQSHKALGTLDCTGKDCLDLVDHYLDVINGSPSNPRIWMLYDQ